MAVTFWARSKPIRFFYFNLALTCKFIDFSNFKLSFDLQINKFLQAKRMPTSTRHPYFTVT